MDLTKTRLQMQGEAASGHAKDRCLGVFAMGGHIVRVDGPLGLWRGIRPAIGRHLVYTGLRIGLYEQLRTRLAASGDFPLWKAMLSGVAAGGFAQILASPCDLIKIQLQMEGLRHSEGLPQRFGGVLHAASSIMGEAGVLGLWKGSVPAVQRAALVNMADLATYDKVKQLLLRETSMADDWAVHALSSGCSGTTASVCSSPMDTVKTRIMNQPLGPDGRGLLYKGTVDCFYQTISQEGFFALYKGFLPTCARMVPLNFTKSNRTSQF